MNSSTTRHHTTLLSELKANFGWKKLGFFYLIGWEPWLVESPDWLRALIGWEPWPQPDYYLLLSVCPVITLGSSWILGEQDDIQWLSVTWLLEQADVPSDWLRHLKAQVDYKKYIHHSSLTPVVVFAVVLWHLSSPSLLVITLAICLSCRW